MAASKPQLTDAQRRVQRSMDLAMDTVVAYTAPTVPSLNNYTAEGLIEEAGRLNAARKAIEKTEKLVKERLKAMVGTPTFTRRSDNFEVTLEERSRVALDQTKAKEVLEEVGRLSECMKESLVPTMTIKEL